MKKKGVVKCCKEHNKDKSIGFTKYEAIEIFFESNFCGVVELNAMLFCLKCMNGILGKK